MSNLPVISPSSTQHPDCCVSLSAKLISTLRNLIPYLPATALSIGSGSGLLEALILDEQRNMGLFGVEVSSQVNKYLPAERLHVVEGTWALDPTADSAQTWLFIYPRKPDLLKNYLEEYGSGAVRRLIWLGPKVDSKEYERIVERHSAGWQRENVKGCDLVSYELMNVWMKWKGERM